MTDRGGSRWAGRLKWKFEAKLHREWVDWWIGSFVHWKVETATVELPLRSFSYMFIHSDTRIHSRMGLPVISNLRVKSMTLELACCLSSETSMHRCHLCI